MILFNNFQRHFENNKKTYENAINRVLASGWYILGRELESFEEEFANYIGTSYCVGVASGTEAIALSLMSLGIGAGDEVITTNITAFPTITGILQSGATPVLIDINENDGLIDYKSIERRINKRSKAILPVHLYGQACDMHHILEISENHNLFIVEDVAQGTGALFNGRKLGSFGHCNAFSFYPTKNLGAFGDAGAITTNDEVCYKKLLMLRNYGQSKRNFHDFPGINSRMDEIQAAILREKLRYIDEWNERRNQIAQIYTNNLKNVDIIKQNSYGISNYHLFVIKSIQRDRLMDHLFQNNIQTLIHYPLPVHKQNAFLFQKDENFASSNYFVNVILSLPMYPELTIKEQNYIIKTINNYNE